MLYNVSFALYDNSTYLIPHIPYSVADDEDHKTKRVCFADSIEHCIEAIGSCHRDLYTGCLIVVRSVDKKNLDPSKIITYRELFDSKKVPDALETHEYWYLDEVKVKRDIYQIKDFAIEYAIAFTCITRDNMADIIMEFNPKKPMQRNETVEQAYYRTINDLYENGLYDASDKFEDIVATLPWARKIKVTNLVMHKITDNNIYMI